MKEEVRRFFSDNLFAFEVLEQYSLTEKCVNIPLKAIV
jgi:hypothetical protein